MDPSPPTAVDPPPPAAASSDPDWLDAATVAVSPLGDVLAVATDRRVVLMSGERGLVWGGGGRSWDSGPVSQNWQIWVGNNILWRLFFHSFPLISLWIFHSQCLNIH